MARACTCRRMCLRCFFRVRSQCHSGGVVAGRGARREWERRSSLLAAWRHVCVCRMPVLIYTHPQVRLCAPLDALRAASMSLRARPGARRGAAVPLPQ